MDVDPNQPQATTPRTRAVAFGELLKADISHGAFRLWHCLYSYMNYRSGLCCPGYDKIKKDIHCNQHSILGWIEELEAQGWLVKSQVEREKKTDKHGKEQRGNKGTGVSNHYSLLDGQGQLLHKMSVLSSAKKRSTSNFCQKAQNSSDKKRSAVLPKSAVKLIPLIKGEDNITNTAPTAASPLCLSAADTAGAAKASTLPSFVKRGMR